MVKSRSAVVVLCSLCWWNDKHIAHCGGNYVRLKAIKALTREAPSLRH